MNELSAQSDFLLDTVYVAVSDLEIRRNGMRIKLTPKAMALLCFLAAHPEQTLTREAIMNSVWRNSPSGDEALSQTMAQLRKAMGDDARRPRFIRTIVKSGYRLIVAPSSITARHMLAGAVSRWLNRQRHRWDFLRLSLR